MLKSRGVMVTMAAALMTMVSGCAMLGGPSDEELIQGTIDELKAALEALDVDRIMAVHSEDYEMEQGGKAELRQGLEYIIDGGYIDDIQLDTADATIDIDGDTAQYGPVYVSGSFGETTDTYSLKKEDGVWRIVGSEQVG